MIILKLLMIDWLMDGYLLGQGDALWPRKDPLEPRIGGAEQTQTSNKSKFQTNPKISGLRGT